MHDRTTFDGASGGEDRRRREQLSEDGKPGSNSASMVAGRLSSMPSLETEDNQRPGRLDASVPADKMVRRGEPLPGSMAALGFTCSPKNYADGITSRVLGRTGGRCDSA